MTSYVGLAIVAVFIAAMQGFNWYRIAKLRRLGQYPEPGKATMADVEQLLKMDSRALAVRCYREIHGCSLRQASEAVQGLASKDQLAHRNHI